MSSRRVSALLAAQDGSLPRRAVLLPDNRVGSRADHPDEAEQPLLTALCDAARSRDAPPRDTRDLLATVFLGTGDDKRRAEAFRAAYDDIKTGDLDFGAATEFFEEHASTIAQHVASALVNARDPSHLAYAACVVGAVVPACAGEATRREIGAALGARLPRLVDAFVQQGRFMRRELKDLTLSALSKVLALGDVPADDLTACLDGVLAARHDDVVKLFAHVAVTPSAGLADRLLDRCARAAPRDRCGLLCVLSRVLDALAAPADAPADPARAARVADVVHSTLAPCVRPGETLDARLALAAAVLVPHAACSPLTVTMSRALAAAALDACDRAVDRAAAAM